jgi:Tol biopolymer transport system component
VATGAHEDLPSKLASFSPALHPTDGQTLIYDGDDGMARDEGLAGLNLETNQTWDVTTDVNDHSPVFSPDGSKIAVSYLQHDHWEVHVMNADGSNRQRLTATSYITLIEQMLAGEEMHSFNNAAPTWSPDGSQIAFLTDRTGQWEIWVMNADGSNQHPLFDTAVQTQLATELGLQYNGVDERMLNWTQ